MTTRPAIFAALLTSIAGTANGQAVVTGGAGSAVQTADYTVTFDTVASGTDLSAYTEDGLNVFKNDAALLWQGHADFPSPNRTGFSGGYLYSVTLVPEAVYISAADGSRLSGVEWNAGDGWPGDSVADIRWEIWRDGNMVDSGSASVEKGSVVGVSDPAGFDMLVVGSYFASSHAANPAAFDSYQNGIAIDNIRAAIGIPDFDFDGVADEEDNCVNVANDAQRDTDADGIGNFCDADLNNDCTIDFLDLGEMKQNFFGSDESADLNGDGSVDFLDLGMLKSMFFSAPGPSGGVNACDNVHAIGSFSVRGTWFFDLDTGMEVANVASADVFWRRQTSTEAYFAPRNGAQLAVFGSSEPHAAGCAAATYSASQLPLDTVDVGIWICALTSDGRYSQFRITDANVLPVNTAGLFEIEFATFN